MAARRRAAPLRTAQLLESLDSKQLTAADKLLKRFENLLKHASTDAERRKVVSEMREQVEALGSGISDLSAQVISKIADDNDMHLSKSYYHTVPDDNVGSDYQKIIDKYYDDLLNGKTKEEALAEAGSSFKQATIDSLNDTRNESLQHASRSVSGAEVVGYRRVIHPELSKGGVCGLCVAAATQRYKEENLKKIHDNCRCTVLPIYKTDTGKIIDPGASMNRSDLGKLYKAAGDSTSSAKLKRTRWLVGPDGTLVPRDDTLVKTEKNGKVNPGAVKINDQSIVTNQPATVKDTKAEAKKEPEKAPKAIEKTPEKTPKAIEKTPEKTPKAIEKTPEKTPEKPPKAPTKVTDVEDVSNNDIGGPKPTSVGPKDIEELIAPDDTPDEYFDEPQEQAAEVLRHAGVDVKSVQDKDISGRQAPDAVVDGMTADIIPVPTASMTAVVRSARYVVPASQAVVLDGFSSGLSMETARESLLRILARYGLRLLAVIIICVDGIIRWMSSD